ncbi:ABC transporter substrate-binding protein [Nocardioides yefusunii]|uniref:ABC transporter substrate-binding protein n=1 Tax=Nocardioides yefusunii TaxID=2500546 RepID=A0ABW1QVC3_9ACTN|nr:extracellular solute-binding protein [Nocardioides yefusunii]
MASKRPAVLTALVVAASMSLAACGGSGPESELADSWDGIVEAAAKEGKVTLYSTHAPENLEALKKAFEAEYPDIKLDFVRGTDADILPKVDVEKKTGKAIADVHMTTDAAWIASDLEDEDASAELVGPSFDAAEYRRAESILDDRWFVTSAAVFGIAWNTNKYPTGLSAPEDVLDPKLKGKVGVSNPSGIPTYVDMWKGFEQDWAPGFVTDLAATGPRIYPSAVAITSALTSGEVWATPVAASQLLAEKEKGAPVDFVVPEKPFGVPWYTHVVGASKNPNAAQLLADFMVTEAGQKAISADYVAALPDVEGTGIAGADVVAQEIKLPDPEEISPEVVTDYQKTWEGLFLKK